MLSLLFLPVALIIGGIIFLIPPSKLLARLSLFLSRPPPSPAAAAAPAPAAKSSEELEMVFATFDKNGDGFITQRELQESLGNLGLFCPEEQVASMVERFDSNGDGLIDLEEFCALYESMTRAEEVGGEAAEAEDLKEAFDVFDGNKDGLITAEELGLVMASLGLRRSEGDCRKMITRVDKDGDGKVNFEEFKLMMRSPSSPSS